ncbi:MAG TPA: hypothetical protein VKK81_13330 [Candidatus Binatia bacterium]|nr:hypothetical protein [Candidatus Binatia bacterium]
MFISADQLVDHNHQAVRLSFDLVDNLAEVARRVETLGSGGGTDTKGVVRRSALVPFGHH